MVAEICIIGDGYSSAVLLFNLAKNKTNIFVEMLLAQQKSPAKQKS